MILDRLDKRDCYRGLTARLVRALEFLADPATELLPVGRHDLDGDNLFALIQEYDTREVDSCRWEAHRRYCDVQFVASGTERIGVAALAAMTVDMPHDEQRDVAFFHGAGDWVTLAAGSFAIFFPHDVHRPCVQVDGVAQRVRKIVVKAAVEN